MVRQAVSNEAGPAQYCHTTRRKSSVWKDFDYVQVPGASAMATCKRCGTTYQASSKKHGTSTLRRHAESSCCAKRAAKRAAPCLQAAAPAADDDKEALAKRATQRAAPCLQAAAPAADDADDDEDKDKEALAKRAAQRAGPCLQAATPAGDDDVEWVKWIDDLLIDPEYDAGLFSREEQQDGGLITTTSSPSTDLTTTDSPFTDGDHHRCSPNYWMPDTHMPQAQSSLSRRFFRKKRERSANFASHQGETTDKGHSSLVNTDWAPTMDDSMVHTDFTFGDAYY